MSEITGRESGKVFEELLKDSGDYLGKVRGVPVLSWRVKDSSSYGARKHNHEALCDQIIFMGEPVFIEAKSSANQTSYRLKYIEDNQFETMLKMELAGAKSWFIIARKDGKTFEVTDAWAVKASVVYTWKGKKSIPWEHVDKAGIRLEDMPALRSNAPRRLNLLPLWEEW